MREACLNDFILARVFILCQKRVTFYLFCNTIFYISYNKISDLNRKSETRFPASISHKYMFKSQSFIWNIEWEIHVQKMFMKKRFIVFPYYHFSEFSMHLFMI